MTSIFSKSFEELNEADIKELELDFKFEDDKYNDRKNNAINQPFDDHFMKITNDFKEKYPTTWKSIQEIHQQSDNTNKLKDYKYLFYQFVDVLFPPSPKKNKFLEHINSLKSNNKANKNLNTTFDEQDTKIGFLGQQGGATIFFVDDIVKLNDDGIKWCENDQKNCNDQDKYKDFSDMLFRFIEYTNNNNCSVKLIHPHHLYEQWGGEDSDDLHFPEKYLKNKD